MEECSAAVSPKASASTIAKFAGFHGKYEVSAFWLSLKLTIV
jgi:hypothetical protein